MFMHLVMKRKTGSKLMIYSKTVETSYLRDLFVAVVSVDPWELRAFMVPINRPFGKYKMSYYFTFKILVNLYMLIYRNPSFHEYMYAL